MHAEGFTSIRSRRVVCLLSSMLAEASISILNVSTYDADFILVQEPDVAKATSMIRDSLKRGLHGLFEQQAAVAAAAAAAGAPVDEGEQLDADLSERETVAHDAQDGSELAGEAAGRWEEGGAAYATASSGAGFGSGLAPGGAEGMVADAEHGERGKLPLLAAQKQSAIVANARDLYLKGGCLLVVLPRCPPCPPAAAVRTHGEALPLPWHGQHAVRALCRCSSALCLLRCRRAPRTRTSVARCALLTPTPPSGLHARPPSPARAHRVAQCSRRRLR